MHICVSVLVQCNDIVYNYFISDASNNPHNLCLVVYHIPAGFVPKIKKHGNAKENSPFYPTWPSTKQCEIKGPKDTVAVVSAKAGGLLMHLVSYQEVRNKSLILRQNQPALRLCGISVLVVIAIFIGIPLFTIFIYKILIISKLQ